MTKLALSAKQLAFVREYVLDFNGKQAAIRAGYSEKGADVQAVRLLGNASVQKAIQDATQQVGEEKKDIKERIIEELQLIAFSRLNDFIDKDQIKPLDDIDRDKIGAIGSIEINETSGGAKGAEWTSVKTKFKLWSKEKALELLMRHLGMLNDKIKLELPEPVVIRRRNGETLELGIKQHAGKK